MRPGRFRARSTAVARNAHPRLRALTTAESQNPYETHRRAHAAAHPSGPRADFRQFLRRLWQAAA